MFSGSRFQLIFHDSHNFSKFVDNQQEKLIIISVKLLECKLECYIIQWTLFFPPCTQCLLQKILRDIYFN